MPAPPKGGAFCICRSAQIKLPLRGKTSPAPGEDVAQRQKGESGERSEPERVRSKPSRENRIAERPQTLRYPEIINNDSAEYAQSATTTTAASGGNREELLGQRPARRKCRPRHEADAGCRNPIAERIQMVFFLGYTKASRRYTATRYAAMKHQMMGSHRMTAL